MRRVHDIQTLLQLCNIVLRLLRSIMGSAAAHRQNLMSPAAEPVA